MSNTDASHKSDSDPNGPTQKVLLASMLIEIYTKSWSKS